MTEVAAEETEEHVTTIEQFNARIAAGIGDQATPVGSMAAWFGPDGKPSHWRPGNPVPFDSFSFIIAIFQDAATVRVYALPAKPPEPQPADWKVRRPLRYTLTKVAPTYVIEEMDLTMMADEIIDERVRLATEINSADAELEKVIALIEFLDPIPGGINVIDRAELLEALEARDHREYEEEPDGEEPDEENVVGVPSAAPLSGPVGPTAPVAPTMPAPPPAMEKTS